MKDETEDQKAIQSSVCLHLSVLTNAILHKDPQIVFVEEDDTSSFDFSTGIITLSYIPKDEDATIGLGYHEIAHEINSEPIDWTEMWVEFNKAGIPFDVTDSIIKKRIHNVMNSLEDHRVEWVMGNIIYPPSDYYLGKMRAWVIRHHVKKSTLETLCKSPLNLHHLLLDRVDLTRFHPNKEVRARIRRTAAEIEAAGFRQKRTTRELYPFIVKVFNAFDDIDTGDLIPEREMEEMPVAHRPEPERSGKSPIKSRSKAMREAKEVKIEDMEDIPDATPSGKSPEVAISDFKMDSDRAKERKESETGERIAMDHKARSELLSSKTYVRPMPANIIHEHEPSVLFGPESENYGIASESTCIGNGRTIANRLLDRLKLGDSLRRNLEDGELDSDTYMERLMDNPRVRLESFDIFSNPHPLVKDHTVCILIDFSGSMRIKDIRNAKGAALMLSTALSTMAVEHSIRAFCAKTGELDTYDTIIKDFGAPLCIEKLRAAAPSAIQNRDSASIRNATEIIMGERGKKIIFVISDGEPCHPDGVDGPKEYNRNADRDTARAIQEAEQQGISVIGVGITSSAQNFISKAYTKGFAVDEISKLPELFVQIYLKETEELRTFAKVI